MQCLSFLAWAYLLMDGDGFLLKAILQYLTIGYIGADDTSATHVCVCGPLVGATLAPLHGPGQLRGAGAYCHQPSPAQPSPAAAVTLGRAQFLTSMCRR